MFKEAIALLLDGHSLTMEQAAAVKEEMTAGEGTEADSGKEEA